MIYLSGREIATTTDLLNATRLSAIPYSGGTLELQFLANLNNATNNFALTIQLPDGDVPVDAQPVLAGQEVEGALGGQIDSRLAMKFRFPAPQGGHFTVVLTETGAAVCTWVAVLRR